MSCKLPPLGWTCSRPEGHEGPCAASLVPVTQPFDTGDLLFTSGSGYFSNIIKQVMGVPWSHLAIGLRLERPYVWEATGHGVGEVPWDTYVAGKCDFTSRLVNPGAGHISVRRLTWPDEETKKDALVQLAGHCNFVKGRPYEKNKRDMLKVAFPRLSKYILGAPEEDLTTLFCWECAAAAMKAMGLLPADRPAGSYPVNEFMADHVPLLRGVVMGPMESIQG